jgi:ubiquinone/menaquinone biosynthesis C-methylase UbiE
MSLNTSRVICSSEMSISHGPSPGGSVEPSVETPDTSGRRAEPLPSVEIDLDVLAEGYRYRPPTRTAMLRAQDAARSSLDPLLDVGGGPGNHVNEWASMGRTGVMIDISNAMIDVARNKSHFGVVMADSQRLPFGADTFGLAYFHMSIQYGDWTTSLSEATRVVRPGGRIEIWTFAPSAIASSSLGRWFPSIAAIDEPRFPEPTRLAEFLGSITASVEVASVDETIERSAADWEKAVRGRFVSSLQAVPDAELEDGIRRFRSRYRGDDDLYRYQSRFSRVTCVV